MIGIDLAHILLVMPKQSLAAIWIILLASGLAFVDFTQIRYFRQFVGVGKERRPKCWQEHLMTSGKMARATQIRSNIGTICFNFEQLAFQVSRSQSLVLINSWSFDLWSSCGCTHASQPKHEIMSEEIFLGRFEVYYKPSDLYITSEIKLQFGTRHLDCAPKFSTLSGWPGNHWVTRGKSLCLRLSIDVNNRPLEYKDYDSLMTGICQLDVCSLTAYICSSELTKVSSGTVWVSWSHCHMTQTF